MDQMVTLSEGGAAERTVDVRDIHLPDTWTLLRHLVTEGVISEETFQTLWDARCIAQDLKKHIIKHAPVETA